MFHSWKFRPNLKKKASRITMRVIIMVRPLKIMLKPSKLELKNKMSMMQTMWKIKYTK
jgi:hypothetical protein